MLTRLPYPLTNRVLFVAFGADQAADPIALGNMGQSIDNLSFGRPPAVKQRPFGFGKGLAATFALVPLPSSFGRTKLDDIVFLIALYKVDPKVKTRKPKFKVLFTPCLFNISLIR